jgi:Mrp family chromosome partitioning ATPase
MQNNSAARQAERAEQDERIKKSLSRIKNTLLVMSGKGGVGKSCIAVNCAVGLAERGFRVGLLDVDLHGPSIPQMLGIPNLNDPSSQDIDTKGRTPAAFADNMIIPARYSDTLSVVSIESMLESNDTPVIWRGPMKIGAIRQFIGDVRWDDLDFLIIDSPPGTGDEPLTVAQTITGARAIIVTTPQNVSLRDVRKSINFCRQIGMPILGLIENMSGLVCPGCGTVIDLFKTGGGKTASEKMNVPFLGRIPILPEIVQSCDSGVPAVTGSASVSDAFSHILSAIEQRSTTVRDTN